MIKCEMMVAMRDYLLFTRKRITFVDFQLIASTVAWVFLGIHCSLTVVLQTTCKYGVVPR